MKRSLRILLLILLATYPMFLRPGALHASTGQASEITLATAHPGQKYIAPAYLVFQIPPGLIEYSLDPAPDWLMFNKLTSTFGGTPDESKDVTYTGITLTLTSKADAKIKQVFRFTLSVRVGPDVAYGPGAGTPSAPPRKSAAGTGTIIASEPDATIPVPRLEAISDLTTASTALSGSVNPATLPAPLSLPAGSAAITPPPNFPQLALRMVDPESHAVASSNDPNDDPVTPQAASGSFSLPVSSLTEGMMLELVAIAPHGYSFNSSTAGAQTGAPRDAYPLRRITVKQATIPLPRLSMPGTIAAGDASITVSADPTSLPPNPVSAKDAKAGTLSNLPSLAVEVSDPGTGKVGRLTLSNGAGPNGDYVEIGMTNPVTLSLKSPLASGDAVRIIAIAPRGYTFAGLDKAVCNYDAPVTQNDAPPLIAENECVLLPTPGDPLMVFTNVALIQPVVTSHLGLSVDSISGSATPSTTGANGATILLGVQRMPLGDPCRHMKPGSIITSASLQVDMVAESGFSKDPQCIFQLSDLSVGASGSSPATTSKTVQTQANGTFSLTLATPLEEEEELRIVQVLPAGTVIANAGVQAARAYSDPVEVNSVAQWGRVHFDFAGGLLTTNNNLLGSTDAGSFSQAHQFIGLTVEKVWTMPGCYLERAGECLKRRYWQDKDRKRPFEYVPDSSQRWWTRHHPGITSFFDGRLTAIPVATGASSSTNSGNDSSNSSSNGGSFSPVPGNLLTTAQTARFGAGAYIPWLLQRWNWHGTGNALFIAPLGKVGFDSVTSATTINVPSSTPGASSAGTVTLEPLYKFWSVGARIGHFRLSGSDSKAPEPQSYMDISFGPYSNLQSYVCKRTPADLVNVLTSTRDPATGESHTTPSTLHVAANGYPGVSNFSGSTCAADYTGFYADPVPAGLTYTIPTDVTEGNPTIVYKDTKTYSFQPWESRKSLYRLVFEGLLKIPATPLYVGFNANIGQRTLGSVKLDHGYAAPDSLEIFFGTKFDVGELFGRLGMGKKPM